MHAAQPYRSSRVIALHEIRSEASLLRSHNPRSFLTGDSPFLQILSQGSSRSEFAAEIVFEHRHEGALGLPHGGLAMGLCLDVWRLFDVPTYPARASFRFGGSGLRLGEPATFCALMRDGGQSREFQAAITKQGETKPYLRVTIAAANSEGVNGLRFTDPGSVERLLPYYRNCFVCGHHRESIGLRRRFRFHRSDRFIGVSTGWGNEDDDGDRTRCFLIEKNELHPAVVASIFDENTGWAGFMETRAAGLTVRMDLTLVRPLQAQERLLFVSRPAGVRGNSRNPRFFMAQGVVLSIANHGHPVPVAYGHGEWVILEAITEQVKQNLLPQDDWQWIFER